MSRIVFFVANDLSREGRALREAASLAADGHDVTVIGVLTPRTVAAESRDGYRIVRARAIRRPHRIWIRPGWVAARREQWDAAYEVRQVAVRTFRRRVATARSRGFRGWARLGLTVLRQIRANTLGTIRAWIAWLGAGLKVALTLPLVGACRFLDLVTGGSADWFATWRSTWEGWATEAVAAAPPADIWAVNDIFTIPAGFRAQRRDGGTLVYHVRDLVIDSGPYLQRPAWTRAWFGRLERRVIGRSTAVVTTTAAMADWLRTRYRPRIPVVVTHNCPPRPGIDIPLRTGALRAAAGIPLDLPVAVYAGGLRAGRGIEQFVEALTLPILADVHGILFGFGELEATFRAQSLEPRSGGRLHVVAAFPLETYLSALADADVAMAVFQPDTPSHRAVIPNKLFEALAAGVPVVASDTPGLRGVLLGNPTGPLGAVCDPTDPTAIAAAIASIVTLPPREQTILRERCHRAAFDRWNWESEAEPYIALFRGAATASRGSSRGRPGEQQP